MTRDQLDFDAVPNEPENPPHALLRLAMDERDLRHFLSDGFIASPDAYPEGKIRSLAHNGQAWTLITSGMEFPVADKAKPCVVEFRQEVPPGTELVHEVLPSSAITHVLFQTEKSKKDFESRNASFAGLATAHFVCVVDTELRFHVMEEIGDGDQADPPRDPDARSGSSTFDESDRSVGAMTAVMASGTLPQSVLDTIAKMSCCNRELVLGCLQELCGDENGCSADALGFVLDTLSEEQWSDGFDPIVMLRVLSDGLSKCGMPAEGLGPWTQTCREILENRAEADPKLMRDGKNPLLRSLLVILRSKPLTVHSVEHWGTTRPGPGPVVMACSLMLAGWYRGFALQDKAKKNQALYRFASRSLAASIGENPDLNPDLELITKEESVGIRAHTLLESGEPIATTRIELDPGLMEAYFATKKVISQMDHLLEVDLDAEQGAVFVRGTSVTVRVTRGEGATIRWTTSWTWENKGLQRGWKMPQYKAIAEIARDSSCSVYPIEFPHCGLHVVQPLETMDHEEIRFHLQSLFSSIEALGESAKSWHTKPSRKQEASGSDPK